VKSVSDAVSSVNHLNRISYTYVSIGEDVGSKSAAVNKPAQHTLCGEALKVCAWLTQTLSQTFDASHSEPPADETVEIDPPGDQVAPGFAVLKATAVRQHELIKDLGFDKRQIVAPPATSHRCKGACFCFISITHEASASGSFCLRNQHYRPCGPGGQRNRRYATNLYRVNRGRG